VPYLWFENLRKEWRTNMNINPIIPTTTKECMEQAQNYYSIGFVKAQFKSAGEIFFVINLGLELGLTPAQSIQNIAIIQNRATVWGDLMLALVHGSGLLEKHSETIEGDLEEGSAKCICLVKRKGFDEATFEFSTEDAKRAGLWKYGTKEQRFKRVPWAAYPLRMLKMRARTFALRDVFPDLLKGLTSREEAMDIPTENVKQVKKTKADKSRQKPTIDGKEIPQKKPTKADNEATTLKEIDPDDIIAIKYSELFGERYLLDSTGNIHLSSGVVYSKEEVEKTKTKTEEEKKEYHSNKLAKEEGNHNKYFMFMEDDGDLKGGTK
jgi:hypothetical protein